MKANQKIIDQIAEIVERGEYKCYGIRFGWDSDVLAGQPLPNSWHPADYVADCTYGERNEALELNGICGFPIQESDSVESAFCDAYAYGFADAQYSQIILIGADGKNDGKILETGEMFGLPEECAVCFENAIAVATF